MTSSVETMPIVLEPPDLALERISAAVQQQYGLGIATLSRLTLGLDFAALTYRATTETGAAYFLKLRRGGVIATALSVPRALADQGATQVVAPLPTRTGRLWAEMDPFTITVYPFIDGTTGMAHGMQQRHWLAFGAALRQVHDAQLPPALAQTVPREAFTLAFLFRRLRQTPWPDVIAALEALLAAPADESPTLRELAAWWQTERALVLTLAERFTALGEQLRRTAPPLALCHADIHPNNLLIDRDDRLWLVDWDEVLYAPNECDLMMGIGGLGNYPAGPRESGWFVEGYGSTDVDPAALAFYRHARALGDIGYDIEQIVQPDTGDAARGDALRRLRLLFAPGYIVSQLQQSDGHMRR